MTKCVAGASVVDLCELGDRLIVEETGKVYKKEKEMKKGERMLMVGVYQWSFTPFLSAMKVLHFQPVSQLTTVCAISLRYGLTRPQLLETEILSRCKYPTNLPHNTAIANCTIIAQGKPC